MKNVSRLFAATVFGSAFLAFVLFPDGANCQPKTQQETLAAFPENVSGIFKTSCVGCHSDQSNGKSKTFLNFSDWDKLKKKDQVKAGKEIVKAIVNKTMPPEGMVKRRPEMALTPEHVASVAAWSKSIKSTKKKKS
jgi:mono/diheme cytochrome c family protein